MTLQSNEERPPKSLAAESTAAFQAAERDFYRAVNRMVEPAISAGIGSPGFSPWGMVLVETVGRATGAPRRVPLLGLVAGDWVIVSTIRGGRSQWVANARANPNVRYWLGGRPITGTARIISAETPQEEIDALPRHIREVAGAALRPASLAGWTFAILQPREAFEQPFDAEANAGI